MDSDLELVRGGMVRLTEEEHDDVAVERDMQ